MSSSLLSKSPLPMWPKMIQLHNDNDPMWGTKGLFFSHKNNHYTNFEIRFCDLHFNTIYYKCRFVILPPLSFCLLILSILFLWDIPNIWKCWCSGMFGFTQHLCIPDYIWLVNIQYILLIICAMPVVPCCRLHFLWTVLFQTVEEVPWSLQAEHIKL